MKNPQKSNFGRGFPNFRHKINATVANRKLKQRTPIIEIALKSDRISNIKTIFAKEINKKYIKNFTKLFSSKIDEKKKLVAKTKNIDIKNKSITLSYKGILTKDEVFCKQGFTDIFFDIIISSR
ncbi:MAG: hypothetical protein MRZ62_07545 [Brachyspira sp.]|nr:hypothetical protein [Brachyspira sp.]